MTTGFWIFIGWLLGVLMYHICSGIWISYVGHLIDESGKGGG